MSMLQGIVLRATVLLVASAGVSAAPLVATKSLKRVIAQELSASGESRPAGNRAGVTQRLQVAPWELRKNLADPSGTPQMPLPDPSEDGNGKSSGVLPANTEFRQPTNGSTPTGWIQLGTPSKWLYTIFDTGSDKLVAKTWDTVSSELATMDQGISGMVLPSDLIYNHANSSSYREKQMLDSITGKLEPMQSRISYGSGTAVTDEGNETVLVGGQALENFSLSEITADTLSLLHTKKGVSGVLGLQHMKNRSLGSSLFSRMRDAGLMTGFGYCRGKNNTGTFIWNDQATEGTEIPVIGEMHWAVHLGQVKVNGSAVQAATSLIERRSKVAERGTAWPFSDDTGDGDADAASPGQDGGNFGSDGFSGNDPLSEEGEDTEVDLAKLAPHLCPDFQCTAILDTGSNIIAGPTEALKGLTSLVNVKSDCSNFDELPDISMTLGNMEVVVKPAGYVMRVQLPKMSDGWLDASDSADIAGSGADGAAADNAGGDAEISDGGAGAVGDGHLDHGETGSFRIPGSVRSKQKMGLEISEPLLPGLHGRGQDFRGTALEQRARRATQKERQASKHWETFLADAAKEYGVDLRTALRAFLRNDNRTDVTELCMPALVPLDKKTKFGPLWVVGTPLLETTYARWSWHPDQESPRIHLKTLSEAKACDVAEVQSPPAANSTMVDGASGSASTNSTGAPAAAVPAASLSNTSAPAAFSPAASAPAAPAPVASASAASAPAASPPAASSAATSFPMGLMRSEQRILAAAEAAMVTSPLVTSPLVAAVGAAFGANVGTPGISPAPATDGHSHNGPVERQLDDIIYPHWAKNLLEV